MSEVDFFVIGAGSGGVRAARMAAGYGAKVAIAEDLYAGGTCVNVGCIPKKLYSIAAHFHSDFEDSRGFGWDVSEQNFDWDRLKNNKVREILRLNTIYENLLAQSGVQFYKHRAVIKDAHTVDVGGELIKAKHILVATGGWPYVPEFPGKELVTTSNEIFDLPQFPKRLVIVGAGYIAVEFASIFAGLGSQTTLVCRRDMPLKEFDDDIRKHFCKEAAKHFTMLTNANVASVHKNPASLLVTLENGTTLEADVVLYATGRKPNTDGLGLENVAVELAESGGIVVDQNFQTHEPSIFAVGDVVGRLALTPVALAEGMFVANHLFGDKTRQMSYQNIPTAVFTHPNIATVGLTEKQALERGLGFSIYESNFRLLKHTLSGRDERTYMKVVVETASDRVLGMHMLGTDAGEILQGFAAAMQCGLTKALLDSTLGIHPTAAEEFVTMRTPRPSK
ncbi:MAG: glutathione-disulfide reductase [Pseudomonadota bacterium]